MRESSDGDAAMPAATVKVMSTKAKLPTLPKAWMKRLVRFSMPSPGKSKASGGR